MIQYAEQQLKILNELKAGQAEIKQEIQELSKEVSWNVVIGLLSPAEIAIHDWFNKMSDHVSTMPKDKDSPRWTVWSRDYRVWAEEVKKGIGNKLLTIHKLMVGQLPGFQVSSVNFIQVLQCKVYQDFTEQTSFISNDVSRQLLAYPSLSIVSESWLRLSFGLGVGWMGRCLLLGYLL